MKTPAIFVPTARIITFFLLTYASISSAQDAEGVASSNTGQRESIQSIGNYWTTERLDSATPALNGDLSEQVSYGISATDQSAPQEALSPQFSTGWNPDSGKPMPTKNSLQIFDNGDSTANSNSLNSYGSPPANPVDYANYGKFQRWTWFGRYTKFPISTIGKLFFTKASGGNFVCSATVVGQNTLITAGHCVSDGSGNFHTNVLFCPSYNNGGVNPTRGCWTATSLSTTTDWHSSQDIDRDYGCVRTSPNGTVRSGPIGDITGWLGMAYNWGTDEMVFSTGYPAGSPFNGRAVIVTAAAEWYSQDRNTSDSHISKYIGNDMTGGSSGGGWLLSMRHQTAEFPVVDDSPITDPTSTTGLANGPFVNGVNSHRRCIGGSCASPPSSTSGLFWQEMGSPNFTNSTTDDRDVHDVLANCI